jgi:drug/metabolite transporter (DMT)-like permease
VLAIAAALGSSFVYGLSDFLGGRKSRSLALLNVLLVSQGAALIALVAILMCVGDQPPDLGSLLWAASAGLCEAVGVAALYRGLAVGAVSIVAPVGATAPAVAVAAAIALGERPGPAQIAGFALTALGIGLTTRESSGGARAGAVRPSVIFGMLSAFGFGGFLVAMDAASEGSVPWALLVARLTAVTVFVAAALITRSSVTLRRADLPALVLVGLLIVAADALYALASTAGALSVVAILSSLYPLVTLVLARIYLGERIQRPRQIGIATTLGGVAALSAA